MLACYWANLFESRSLAQLLSLRLSGAVLPSPSAMAKVIGNTGVKAFRLAGQFSRSRAIGLEDYLHA
jgi:hypothetical protein